MLFTKGKKQKKNIPHLLPKQVPSNLTKFKL